MLYLSCVANASPSWAFILTPVLWMLCYLFKYLLFLRAVGFTSLFLHNLNLIWLFHKRLQGERHCSVVKTKRTYQPGMLRACNPRIPEAEAGWLWVLGWPGLSRFKECLDYKERPCLKKKQERRGTRKGTLPKDQVQRSTNLYVLPFILMV